MIKIENLEVAIPAYLLTYLDEKSISTVIEDIANSARAKWVQLADAELNTSRATYVDSLREVEMTPGVATISLVGSFADMVENGVPGNDLRNVLLGPDVPVGHPGKNQSKDGGYYRAIPFRHTTPSAKAGTAGTAMGSAYGSRLGDKARKLGKDIYKAAKQLAPTLGEPYKGTKWGERLAKGVGGATKLKPHHSADIYAGMVKMEKTYKKNTSSQYMTFRTISENQPDGWMFPEGRHLVDKVAEFVAQIAPDAFTAYVEGLATSQKGGTQGGIKS